MDSQRSLPPDSDGQHSPRAPDAPERTDNCQLQEDQSQFAVDWQLPGVGPNGQHQQCKIDGESRFVKRARKSSAKAQWYARRRAERFAKRLLGFLPFEQTPTGSAPAEQGASLLVVGGLGDLGQKHLQPALEELPPGVAHCLDYVGRHAAAE